MKKDINKICFTKNNNLFAFLCFLNSEKNNQKETKNKERFKICIE
jgi:hypothetical protein